jgi:hypothetical protein
MLSPFARLHEQRSGLGAAPCHNDVGHAGHKVKTGAEDIEPCAAVGSPSGP